MDEQRDARFKCRCCGVNYIDPRVIPLHREMEIHAGEKLAVTSGYRCERHNRDVGGKNTSSHVKGLAWDVACDSSDLRYRLVAAAIRVGVARIGIGKNFMHFDIDRQKTREVIWLY